MEYRDCELFLITDAAGGGIMGGESALLGGLSAHLTQFKT